MSCLRAKRRVGHAPFALAVVAIVAWLVCATVSAVSRLMTGLRAQPVAAGGCHA